MVNSNSWGYFSRRKSTKMASYIIGFLPIAIIAIGCGIVKLTGEAKTSLREQINAFTGGIILCICIFLALSYLDLEYNVRVGLSGFLTFIGLDKAIEYFNKIRGSN